MAGLNTSRVGGLARAGDVREVGRLALAVAGFAVSMSVSMSAAAAAATPAASASPPPDVDAIVSYETVITTAAGVTRTESWKERLVRRGDVVWTERVLPAGASHAAEPAGEHAGHKHFDFDGAARLVERDASGATRLRYVDRDHKVVVSVPKAEYGAVGFDGRWDAAAHVLPPAAFQAMAPTGQNGWRAQTTGGWSHRVRWSEAARLPLRIESTRADGNARRVVTVLTSTPAKMGAMPWSGLDAYTQKEYDDFMD